MAFLHRGVAGVRRVHSPRLGEAGTHLHLRGLLREPLHRCHRLGGSPRAQFPETRLRLLGWRPHLPRARGGDRAGHLDLAQRLQSARYRACQPERLFRRGSVERRREAAESAAPRIPAPDVQPPRPGDGRRHTVLRDRRHLVAHRHQPPQVVRRWRRTPDRAGSRLQGLRALAQAAGLQLDQHDRGLPQLDDRWPALARGDERRGEDHGAFGLAGIRSRERQEHGQRGRTPVPLPRQSARLREHVPRRRPHQPGILPLRGPQDRLPERRKASWRSSKFRAAMPACAGRNITAGPIPTRGSSSTSGRATRPTTRCSAPSTWTSSANRWGRTITCKRSSW